jgi:hypothetical protein
MAGIIKSSRLNNTLPSRSRGIVDNRRAQNDEAKGNREGVQHVKHGLVQILPRVAEPEGIWGEIVLTQTSASNDAMVRDCHHRCQNHTRSCVKNREPPRTINPMPSEPATNVPAPRSGLRHVDM